MSERFPIATHHKKRLYVPKKRMYQLWTPRFNQGVGTMYLIPIEMPMGKFSNMSPYPSWGPHCHPLGRLKDNNNIKSTRTCKLQLEDRFSEHAISDLSIDFRKFTMQR